MLNPAHLAQNVLVLSQVEKHKLQVHPMAQLPHCKVSLAFSPGPSAARFKWNLSASVVDAQVYAKFSGHVFFTCKNACRHLLPISKRTDPTWDFFQGAAPDCGICLSLRNNGLHVSGNDDSWSLLELVLNGVRPRPARISRVRK